MAFCRFSSEAIINNQTALDNVFIEQYLPSAPDLCVKVYVYGLLRASNSILGDNTLSNFASSLNLSEEDVENAFLYWQEQGLVHIVPTQPFEVRYMPVKTALKNTKFSKDKFANFNILAQEIISGREISPNEYYEYYTVIDCFHMEPEALLKIMQYCVQEKGNKINYPYITRVAKNWASENVRTLEAVESRLEDFTESSAEAKLLLSKMGHRRTPSVEELATFKRWQDMDFSISTLCGIASMQKNNGKSINFEKLDILVKKYFEQKLYSLEEITEFEENRATYYEIAKSICKNLGVYYENLSIVVETYITKWLAYGYDKTTLDALASYAFRSSIRTLEGLNEHINKLYKLGIVSGEALEEYLTDFAAKNATIRELLEALGLKRNVSQWDRDYYKTWTQNWKMSKELIDYGATLANGKTMPLQYLNKLLSSWKEKNITDKAQAEKHIVITPETKTTKPKNLIRDTDLNQLFDNLDEIEI